MIVGVQTCVIVETIIDYHQLSWPFERAFTFLYVHALMCARWWRKKSCAVEMRNVILRNYLKPRFLIVLPDSFFEWLAFSCFLVSAIKQFFADALSMTTRGKETSPSPAEEVMETTINLKRYLTFTAIGWSLQALWACEQCVYFCEHE